MLVLSQRAFSDVFFFFNLSPSCFFWRLLTGGAVPWRPVYAGYGMAPMAGMTGASAMAVPVQRHVVQSDRESPVDMCRTNLICWSLGRDVLGQGVPVARILVECLRARGL